MNLIHLEYSSGSSASRTQNAMRISVYCFLSLNNLKISKQKQWKHLYTIKNYYSIGFLIFNLGLGPGYSQKIWVGLCGPLPKTLTLFMTKNCDFPYPIYDLTKNLIPYLWPDSSCSWLYLACVAGVKRGRGRQSADGRRRAWWRSSFF